MGKILIIKGASYQPPVDEPGAMQPVAPSAKYYFFQPLATNYLSSSSFTWAADSVNRIKAVWNITNITATEMAVRFSLFQAGCIFRVTFFSTPRSLEDAIKNAALTANQLSQPVSAWSSMPDSEFTIPAGAESVMIEAAIGEGQMGDYMTQQVGEQIWSSFDNAVRFH